MTPADRLADAARAVEQWLKRPDAELPTDRPLVRALTAALAAYDAARPPHVTEHK